MLTRLERTTGSLSEGLKNHFAKEEKYLPPVLGNLLMRSLLRTHKQIKAALRKVEKLVGDNRLEGLSQEELKAKELDVKRAISDLTEMIDNHADKEEQLLGLVIDAIKS